MQNESIRKSRVVLHPSNQPSGNSYLANNYSVVSFQIAKQYGFLDTSTLRLNGEFYLEDNNGDLPINQSWVGPGGGAPPPADPANGATVNNSVGISSLFEEVNCSTLNNRNIENVRNYNRYLATCRPLMNSSLELNNGVGLEDPMQTDKSILNARTANVKVKFSVPIEIGLFDSPQSPYLNISEKGFHGLMLDILLCRGEQAVQPYIYYQGVKPGDKVLINAQNSPFSYNIKNLTLSYNLINPGEKAWREMPSSGALTYNTISSLHSTLLSSNQTVNLRFGASAVSSVVHSIIPSVDVNNITKDSLAIKPPTKDSAGTQVNAQVNQIQVMRAGVLYPYNFPLDSEAQTNQGLDNASVQAKIMKPYLNSVSLYRNRYNKFCPLTNIGLNSKNSLAGGTPDPLSDQSDPHSVFGLGVPLGVDAQATSYSNREYALQVKSELDDVLANSLFTYARVKNVASYSPAGISVIE